MKGYLFYPLLVLLFTEALFTPLPVSAQNKVMVSGATTDTTGKPVSFVTVRLFKQKDPANPLQTTLSQENGSFKLNKVDSGNYILTFSHTGFAEKKYPLAVSSSNSDIQVGSLQLSRATAALREVTVITKRPLVEQSDDKIIFNAEDDPATKTETALDILRKTPFVSVDGEDNIKVNGKSNFKVLLNGRETSMFARNVKEALRGFPGALISKIEVITTPSAKYDGEGIGGLINVITKKKVAGYNGSVSSFLRTMDKIKVISVNGNAKAGKVGASVFFHTGDSDPVWQENTITTIPAIPTAYSRRSLDGMRSNSGTWSFGNAELSWEMDSLNTISTYANINSSSNRSVQAQTINTMFTNSPSTMSFYNLDNKSETPGVSVGTDYIKKFKKNKEKEFTIRFFGEFGKSNSFLTSSQDNPGTDRFINNNSKAINNQYTFQSDYSTPLKKKGKLESGVKAIIRRASSDFESLIKYDPASAFKRNDANTDKFKYTQDVVSVYSMYSIRVKKSSYRFGARVEHTTVDGDFTSSNTVVNHSYTTLLPNIQFTNRLSSVLTMVLTYNKRLQRPYIWDLNPFVNNNDSLNISFGNPNLGPQTIHSLSAQMRFTKGATFGGVNLETSYSDNKILDYAFFDPGTGVTKTTSLNIGKEFQSALSLNLNTKLSDKITTFVNGSLRFSKVTNNSKSSQSNQGFGFGIYSNTTYKVSGKFSISSFLGLWNDPVTIQTTYPLTFWYNLAFNQKLFKDKFSVSLRAVNFIEKTHDYKTVTRDENFTTTNINKQLRRAVALALSYNFGKLTENVSRKKGVNNDDLLNKQTQTQPNN